MDAYQTLDIPEDASAEDIKKAYRRLARKFHPDRSKVAGAKEKFQLIKEAYEYITTGVSSSGRFNKEAPRPPDPPDPWATPPRTYPYSSPPLYSVIPITLDQVFTGGVIHVPKTSYHIKVRPGIEHGYVERTTAFMTDGRSATSVDAQYHVYDPTGFYELMMVDGMIRLCCKVKVTIASLLLEEPIEIRNANPKAKTVSISFPFNERTKELLADDKFLLNNTRWFKVAGAGLVHAGRRGVLYVEPDIIFKPIHQEIFPTLKALKEKIDAQLKGYQYFR